MKRPPPSTLRFLTLRTACCRYRGETTGNPRALRTDTDDEIRAGVKVAKSLGMWTSLSPMFDPDYSQFPIWNASSGGPTSGDKGNLAGGGEGRGAWGRKWTSSQIRSWFGEYGPVIVQYAKLADELKVDEYHVGHELHTLLTNPANEQDWRALIAQVRAVFHGKVSVAFNGNPFFNDLAANGVPWLDALDHIGLDCYVRGRRTPPPPPPISLPSCTPTLPHALHLPEM